MIKLAFKVYAFVAILAPWVFLFSRFSGLYNFPRHNTQIFLGLFIFSGIVMFMTFKNWGEK